MRILLPEAIKAQAFLQLLSDMEQAEPHEEIILDFARLKRVTPTAMAAIGATVVRWRKEKKVVSFVNVEACPIKNYLLRMDFLSTCGIETCEDFARHDAAGRFVPVRLIDHAVEDLCTKIAECVAPGGGDYGQPLTDLYDLAWYVLSETANNVRQHSQGLGYVCAQVTHADGLLRLAIADNGKGILRSFQDVGFDWAENLTEAQAIQKALEPRVSSKGRPNNEGVGLTLVTELARATKARIAVFSGSGFLSIGADGNPTCEILPNGGRYRGTLVAMAIRQRDVGSYADMLNEAKIRVGLLQKTPARAGIFEK